VELEELLEVSRRSFRVCAGATIRAFKPVGIFELARSDKIGKINAWPSRGTVLRFFQRRYRQLPYAPDIDCRAAHGDAEFFQCAFRSELLRVVFLDSAIVSIEGSTGMHDNYPFTTRLTFPGKTGRSIWNGFLVRRDP
jgi:hypothetical protein